MAMIPRTEYNSLRSEVRALQQQQKVISNVLSQIRRQNDQLYQQATAFQTLHDRHENSINAILTFLATFYNRSLEGQSGVANFADMFAPSLQQQQSHGNVVDVDEFPDKNFGVSKSPQMQRPGRRPLALLPAPAAKDGSLGPDRAATISPSVRSTASPMPRAGSRPTVFSRSPAAPNRSVSADMSNPGGSNVQPKAESPSTPQTLHTLPEKRCHHECYSEYERKHRAVGHARSPQRLLGYSGKFPGTRWQLSAYPATAQ